MNKKINFEDDLKIEIHSAFDDLGVKIPIRNNLDTMLFDYLTILKKLIKPRPREVLINPDFVSVLQKHEKKREVEQLRRSFLLGKSVNHFQSKRLFQSKFHDHLCYEWNIYHFHLSFDLEKRSKFVKQTDQLLFVYIEDTKAIFLGIDKHSPGVFADVKWPEVLHTHFPETIAQYRDKEISEVSPSLNAIERQILWDKGYTLGLTKVGDAVYIPPGIGRTTSGHSTLVAKTSSEVQRWLFALSEDFDSREEDICRSFGISQDNAKFKVQFVGEKLGLIEVISKQILLTFPQRFDFDNTNL